jgi:PPE family
VSFFTLPPEINSLRMFIGAGSTPMLEAAAAWEGLAEELGTAAQSFSSVTAGLAGQAWQGAASAAMAAAAAPYAAWLNAAASLSSGAGGNARAVASMFEAAQAATILPQSVAANRNGFVQLVMSNLFGQNAPLIAAAESFYEEMWAADVSAMSGYYSGASAVAAQVVPWQSALQSLPALGGGMAGMAGGAGGGMAAPVSGSTGGANAVGGSSGGAANGAASGAASSGGASGFGAGGLAGAGSGNGLTTGNPGAGFTQSDASGVSPDASQGAYTSANSGSTAVASGASGIGMMPIPMGMGGRPSAGLLNDGPGVVPVKVTAKAEEEEASAAEVEEEEAAPELGVLSKSAADLAPKAAAVSQATIKQSTGSGIPGSALRSALPLASEAAQATEAVTEGSAEAEAAPTLRPEAASGKLRPQAKKETPKIQVRGS